MNCCLSQLAHLFLHHHSMNIPLPCLCVPLCLPPFVCKHWSVCLFASLRGYGFTVCKVSGNAATPTLNIVWPRWKWKQNIQNLLPLCFLSSGSRCRTLPGLNTLYSSVFSADDHPDCPQCFSHMTVVIQLVTESAPKPSQCRLAQEKYRVGDSISTRAFPASCSFNRASL